MDLKTFISETLTSIIEGVHDAQGKVKEISPTSAIVHLERRTERAGFTNPISTSVQFDVAVTTAQEASNETGAKAGLRIHVISAGVSGKEAESTKSSAVSRVQFAVPVHLPVMSSSQATEADNAAISRNSTTASCY